MRITDPRLAASLALSAILHAAAAMSLAMQPPAGRTDAAAARPLPSLLTVRIVRPADTAALAETAEPEPAPEPTTPEPAAPPTEILPLPAPPAAPHTSVAGDIYLPAARLDEAPRVIDDVPIDPPFLRKHREGGRLVLELWIGERGTVDKVDEIFSDLPPEIGEELRRNFYAASFRPGILAGQPTKSRMRIEVRVEPLPDPGPVRRQGSGQPLREGEDD